MKQYKPNFNCCNHYKTNTYRKGYLANHKTGKVSKFIVFVCDNCGEVQSPYKGIKGFLFDLYFRYISKGCIYIEV